MAPQKKVIKTYGKRTQKTLMSDNWLSPESKQPSKSANAFSDQSNDSSILEERGIKSTNEQSEKELCNLLSSKLELSSSDDSPVSLDGSLVHPDGYPDRPVGSGVHPGGTPVLVPETPESEMKTCYRKKRSVIRNDSDSADSKDNHAALPDIQNRVKIKKLKKVKAPSIGKENKCTRRSSILASNKLETIPVLEDIFELEENHATDTVREKTSKRTQKETDLPKKKNIKKKGKRVSILHSNVSIVNLENLSKAEAALIDSPCEVMLSRLVLHERTPDTSSPKVCKSQDFKTDRTREVENSTLFGIDDYIPAHLSPVVELTALQDQCWTQRLSGNIHKSMTPCRGKRGKILSSREKVLLHCGQSEVLPFSGLFTEKQLECCRKIGEGVYGEVYQVQLNADKVAIKIIPIEGELVVNDEPQKTFEEILPEIVISKELSSLRGPSIHGQTDSFIEVKAVHCCHGQFPLELLRKWDEFDKLKGSDNDRPDSYCDQQLFIVFVFANGGCDLESFQFDNSLQMKSVLQQTVGALAVAEATLQFEHRDLHWGNVLVKKQEDTASQGTVLGQDTVVEVVQCGLDVSIIDFTLSRLHKDGCTLFYDLSNDASLFEGEGDYQFDMYRLMRDHNNNKWDSFNAYSNVLWLHYLTRKLLEEKKVKRSRKKVHVQALQQLKAFESELLKFKSAQEIVKMSELFIN